MSCMIKACNYSSPWTMAQWLQSNQLYMTECLDLLSVVYRLSSKTNQTSYVCDDAELTSCPHILLMLLSNCK